MSIEKFSSLDAIVSQFIKELATGKVKKSDAPNWFHEHANQNSLRPGRHYDLFFNALKERGVDVPVQNVSAGRFHSIKKINDLERLIEQLSDDGKTTAQISQELVKDLDQIKPILEKVFERGKFPDVEIYMRRKNLITTQISSISGKKVDLARIIDASR